MVSCGGPRPVLEIDQFHLRDSSSEDGYLPFEDQVEKADRIKRLYGAVSAEERKERLGDYYTVRWNGPLEHENEEIRIVFDYRQAATGSAIKSMEQRLPAASKGACEFIVNRESYRKGGRVLAWRVRYYRGGELIVTKRSYLWD